MVTAAVVWTYWLSVVGLIVEGIFFAGLVWGYFHYVARPRYELDVWRAQLEADAATGRAALPTLGPAKQPAVRAGQPSAPLVRQPSPPLARQPSVPLARQERESTSASAPDGQGH
jgi:hypothetical protein